MSSLRVFYIPDDKKFVCEFPVESRLVGSFYRFLDSLESEKDKTEDEEKNKLLSLLENLKEMRGLVVSRLNNVLQVPMLICLLAGIESQKEKAEQIAKKLDLLDGQIRDYITNDVVPFLVQAMFDELTGSEDGKDDKAK